MLFCIAIASSLLIQNAGMYKGSHLPMGYYEMAERDPNVLFANYSSSIAWGGHDGAAVAATLLKHLGVVDEVPRGCFVLASARSMR